MKLKHFTLMLILFLMTVMLSACAAPPEVSEFFAGYTWTDLVTLFLAALFGFFPGFRFFGWLKDQFNLEGQAAHWLVVGASLLLTIAAMYVTNSFDLPDFKFDLQSLIALGLAVYTASQFAYKRFKDGLDPQLK